MNKNSLFLVSVCVGIGSCAPTTQKDPYVPSMRYAQPGSPSPSIHDLSWKGGVIE